MSHGSRGPPNSMDEVREAAVQRRLNNPVENILMNSILGAVMGAFVGYSGGALIGAIRRNSELPMAIIFHVPLSFYSMHTEFIM
jgi:NhaP-type Na+/H+ or K+/H+ antiporter